MKATDKQQMYNNIQRHGEQLNAIFNTGIEPIELCKKLFRIEKKASHASTCLCNTNTLNLLELNRYTGYEVKQATEEEQERFFNDIRKKVVKILGSKAENLIYINMDPRGYSLKIKSEEAKNLNICTDFGGYGIIAPDFTP